MSRCLFCYKDLMEGTADFHPSCARKIFGQSIPPLMPYSEEEIASLASRVIQSKTVVTGVQAKLSLQISRNQKDAPSGKFTLVGLWGGYILKPPSALYPELPEVEDLTMHLAQYARIKTAPHSLIRLPKGNLAYITKRIDRSAKGKLAMEDMCQLTERLTEDKYRGSYEQIGKTIQKYSATPGLDLVNFFELVLFSFLTGNADMHLKNFSLLEQPGLGMTLSPAYDLVNTVLVNPADEEEMALTLNGRKNRIKKQDFEAAMRSLQMESRQQDNIFRKLLRAIPFWFDVIDHSFLTAESKERYKAIIRQRMERLS